jgi:hypothetical protein
LGTTINNLLWPVALITVLSLGCNRQQEVKKQKSIDIQKNKSHASLVKKNEILDKKDSLFVIAVSQFDINDNKALLVLLDKLGEDMEMAGDIEREAVSLRDDSMFFSADRTIKKWVGRQEILMPILRRLYALNLKKSGGMAIDCRDGRNLYFTVQNKKDSSLAKSTLNDFDVDIIPLSYDSVIMVLPGNLKKVLRSKGLEMNL